MFGYFFLLNIHRNYMHTNQSKLHGEMRARGLNPCVFFENNFLTLHLLFHTETSFFTFVLVTLCIPILARLWIQRYLHPLYDNFSLSSSEHSGHHRIQSRHNQRVKDGHSQSPAFMFNHIRDDSVYMGLLVLLQPWSRLCVIRKKGFIWGQSASAHHCDLWPSCICRLRWLFDLFSHSDPPGKRELVWNW